MILKKVVILFTLFFLYSCAKPVSIDNVEKIVNIPKERNNKSLLINSATDNFTSNNPVENFKYMINDKNLNDLIIKALDNNLDVLILASKIRQARSEALIAGANLFPSISVGLDYTYGNNATKPSSGDGKLNFNSTFSWELDIFGKINNNRKSAKERVFAAENDLLHSRVTLISDVANYYFSIRNSAFQIVVYKEIIKNYEDLLEVYKKQLDFGLVEVSDVVKAENEYLSAYNNMKNLEVEIEKSKNALIILTGQQDIQFDLYDTSYIMPQAKTPNIDAIPTKAIVNRPDVMSSIYSLNSAIYQTAGKKAALYPSITIGGNIGQILASSTGVGDLLWSIASSLTAPLINRKELYETLRIQQETEKQMEYTLKKTISTALGEIEDTIFQLNSNSMVYENSVNSFKNSSEIMNFIESKYNYGLVDIIEFLKSKNEFYNAKIMLNTAEYNRIISNINLYKAFGGSFGEPLEMVKYGTDY